MRECIPISQLAKKLAKPPKTAKIERETSI